MDLQITCPYCNGNVPSANFFCPLCGKKLKEKPPSTTHQPVIDLPFKRLASSAWNLVGGQIFASTGRKIKKDWLNSDYPDGNFNCDNYLVNRWFYKLTQSGN